MAEQDIAIALTRIKGKSSEYQLYYDYAEGRHRLTFATEKFRNAFGALFREFAANYCRPVITLLADRLVVTGFSVEAGPEETAQVAWDIWMANRMDQRAGEVHLEAITAGDAYVIVWPDASGLPVIYPNPAVSMTVRYDPEMPGRIIWAAKIWEDDESERWRLNLYYPDRIEKYISRQRVEVGLPDSERAFDPVEVPGESWPLPNPYGQVPVFHFANNGRLGRFGRSEIADVIPLQDGLNKCLLDEAVAREFVALPQRWATGLEVEIDEATGKPRMPFVPGADRIWAVGDPNVRFGQFEPGNLTQFHLTKEGYIKDIAAISTTPPHYLIPPTGQWPSGESLKSAEGAFLKKVKNRQVVFGNVWEDVMAFTLRVMGYSDTRLSCLWEDPTPRNEVDRANIALIKSQLGIPQEQIWRDEFGYSEDQIARMLEEREASSQQLGERLIAAFEQGE